LKGLRDIFADYRLKWFDLRSNSRENKKLSIYLIRDSAKPILISVSLILVFIAVDTTIEYFLGYLSHFERQVPFNKPPLISDLLRRFFAPKNIERFADLISVSAGVLGVILGLFYTAFLTLISTKYSNISSSIRRLIIDQKAINKYFKLLTLSTSLSIMFQLAMTLGYVPSIFSCFLFAYLIIVTLNSFVEFGKYSLIYFDTGNLISDILSKNYFLLEKIEQRKTEIDRLNRGEQYLSQIYQNLITIEILIKESIRLQASATYSKISDQLRKFLIYFNSIKYIIPTAETWHLKRLKLQNWLEAKDWDHNLLKSTGVALFPQQETDYDIIEKKVFQIQFLVFSNSVNDADKVALVGMESKYLYGSSYQMNLSIISDYFKQLRAYLENSISSIDTSNERFRYNLIVTYTDLIKSFLVGFSQSHPTLSNTRLQLIADKTFSKEKIEFSIPYFLRKWHDDFIAKLNLEYKVEGRILTPHFYSHFEISNCFQNELQIFWKQVCRFFMSEIKDFSQSLINSNQKREALSLNVSSIEIALKIIAFNGGVEARIDELNALNFESEQTPFSFQDIIKFKDEVELFRKSCINQIINLGILALDDSDENLPDTFGTSYGLVREEIVDQLLSNDIDIHQVKLMLPKYLTFAFLYLEKVFAIKSLESIQKGNKAYPILRDVMDIVAIAIIVDKLHESNEIIESLIKYSDRVHQSSEDELNFWDIHFKIYDLFRDSSYVFSNSSYNLQHNRSRRFIQYLKSHKNVQIVSDNSSSSIFTREKYVISNPDIYLKAIVTYLDTDGMNRINLDEIFIEYFLRTRTALKKLNIKETDYGSRIRQIMGAKT
jgi:hypothetical protein